MGASHSHHVRGTLKITDGGENVRVKYASSSMQGWCAKMEDACAVVPDLDGATSFFGVYDGHGGAEVALFCARQFHIELRSHPNYQNNLNIAMRSVFSRMDELLQQSNEWMELVNPKDSSNWIQNIMRAVFANHWPFTKETPYIAPQYMGSTACVAVIQGSRITVANVGNSHCVVSKKGQAIELSYEHKAFERDESRRIRKAGGRVWMDKIVLMGPQIPVLGRAIEGALAISRVIGDFAFKQNKNLPPSEQMAICDPHLESMEITKDVEFLVMASRGICECMKSPQNVVDFVHEEFKSGETDLRVICERLVDCSVPSGVNTTAILLQFKDQDTAPESSQEHIPDETVARALAFLKGKQIEIAEGSKSS